MGSRVALGMLGALAAMPAAASDKSDFEACDGRVHPGRQDDGMRGEASQRSFFGRVSIPNVVVASCTRALASPRLLPGQSLRRAHLLRARAAAHLQAEDPAAALADLDLAEAATAGLAGDRFYQRSMGVSLQLLRALARAQSGDMVGAVPLAQAASAARPYALQVQEVAATILQAGRPVGKASPSPWLAARRLAPGSAMTALLKEAEVGNFAGVLALRPAVTIDWPAGPLEPLLLFMRAPGGSSAIVSTMVSLHVAYARAATGDPAGARRDLAEVRTRVGAAKPVPKEGATVEMAGTAWSALDRYVDMRGRQIEARVAVAEGRMPDAIAALVATPLPRDAATVELLTALRTAAPAKDAALVPDIAPFMQGLGEERKKALAGVVQQALLAPETPRSVVDYERARPNILGALVGGALSMGTSLLSGISRTDGFRTTANPDGTTKVEFLGNTPSAALVQEMTLLRAAEVARAAGKPAFIVVERKDFVRQLKTMQYGTEISSVPQGFKTELTIRCVDAGVEPDRALDAVAIIDALGPLYYEDKPKTG
ncbi:hypothetical protein U1769_01760 [Sphingomonas sp. ZT3P38]|uniref:hypothetical protein n=1 Tax=Parasphingomonas zepuensis TaxID=3096161 RepID=UPI002FCAA102